MNSTSTERHRKLLINTVTHRAHTTSTLRKPLNASVFNSSQPMPPECDVCHDHACLSARRPCTRTRACLPAPTMSTRLSRGAVIFIVNIDYSFSFFSFLCLPLRIFSGHLRISSLSTLFMQRSVLRVLLTLSVVALGAAIAAEPSRPCAVNGYDLNRLTRTQG